MEDWALIRRLVADGVPQRQVARDLGIGRSTVARALASDRPPKYERPAVPTSFTPFEPRVRQLLAERPGHAGDGDRRAGRLDRVDHVVPRQRAAAAAGASRRSTRRTG